MINSITIKKTNTRHFTNRLFHNKNKDITYGFNDGINIVTGRNGSGKSVLLDLIKTNCGIMGRSTYSVMPTPMELNGFFSENWQTIPEWIETRTKNLGLPAVQLQWDGSIVHHLTPSDFNSDTMWGRMDNMVSTKQSFSGLEILDKMMSSRSSGENTNQILHKLLSLPERYDEPLTNANDLWLRASKIHQDWLLSFKFPKGKPTLLIDELDNHLDIDNQSSYWKLFEYLSEKWQVIVVSHSIFAFKQKNVKYINLTPGYFKTVKKLIK